MPHWIKKCCAKDDVCSICQESLINISGMDNIIYELYCGNQFHTRCLMNYIPNKNK